MVRCQKLFLALILTQAAHSVGEYVFRLYDVLLPARVISGLISDDLALGLAVWLSVSLSDERRFGP